MKLIVSILFFSIIPFLPTTGSAKSLEWKFNTREEIRNWRGEGIEGSRVQDGIFQVMGKEQFRLISPPNLKIPIKNNPYLRIRFRPMSPRYLRVFWQPRRGNPVLLPDIIQPTFDRNFHTVWIPLTEDNDYRDTIEQFGLIFGGRPGWIEIDNIEIRSFSLLSYISDQWHEFWLTRSLNLGTINSLSSPIIGGWSLISLLNLAVIIVFIISAAFYFRSPRTGRRKVIITTGLTLLGLWIVYDLRGTYSQFQVAAEINRTYIQPPYRDKTYPSLGDFLNYVKFCEENLPEDIQYHFYRGWPYDTRIKYYLYPRRINCDASSQIIPGRPIPYHVIYQNPSVKYDPLTRRLRYSNSGEEFFISNPGKIIATFDRNSFIFLEERK